MKILRRNLNAATALILFTLLAACLSFLLIALYKISPSNFLNVTAPTTYDGLSYYNEISVYGEDVRSLNIASLLKSYGLLVVILYSPIFIFPLVASWWCLAVNCCLLLFSAASFAIVVHKSCSYSASICKSLPIVPLGEGIIKSGVGPLAILVATLLILLNPYYIGSIFVPSKDILALSVSISYLLVLVGLFASRCKAPFFAPGIISKFIIILIFAFFVRLTLFLGLLFSTAYILICFRKRSGLISSPLAQYFVCAILSSSIFLVYQTVSFDSAGLALNKLLASPLKFVFIPALPFIYSLWDFLKSPDVGPGGINIVQLGFSLNGTIVLPLIASFFVYLYSGKANFRDASSRSLWAVTAIALAVPMASGYVHVRYIYEFIPWLLVSFSFASGYSYIRLFLFRLLPFSAIIKLSLYMGGLLLPSPVLPLYSLPPHLM